MDKMMRINDISLPRVSPRVLFVLMSAGLLLLPVYAQLIDVPFYITLVSRMMIFAIIALSLGFILGFAGMVCFGQAAFAGIGAYVVLVFNHHAATGTPLVSGPLTLHSTASAFVTWPMAMLVSAFAAFVIGVFALRTRGVYFIMITLAFAQMIYFFFINLKGYGGEDGMRLSGRSTFSGLIDLGDQLTFYYVTLAVLALVYFLLRRLVDSRFGLVLRGNRQNERRMAALGFSTMKFKLVAFTMSGAIAGLAGALMVNHGEFISPAFMHWVRSSDIIAMVVLGGYANLMGPVLGAGIILGLEDVLSSYTEHWQIIYGPLLLLVVLFARRGMYGIVTGRGADND